MTMMHYWMKYFMFVLMMTMIKSDALLFYESDRDSKPVFDCLYSFIPDDRDNRDKSLIRTSYLTPYCRHSLSNDSVHEREGSIESSFTFEILARQGVSSEDLLLWSVAIDNIEQYAIYLDKNDTRLAETVFHNCSSSWFGSHCQYTFGLNMSIESFGDYIISTFENRKQYERKLLIHTCYTHLPECYRGPEPMCLDWREICDGKVDCIDGSFGIDEKYCHELELNQCKEDEYRCHNGAQCIPSEFFRDGWTRTDCLDGTDEDERFRPYDHLEKTFPLDCTKTTTFACEETTCRSPGHFSCGDGQCLRGNPTFNLVGHSNTLCLGTSRDTYYSKAILLSAKQYPAACYKLLFCKLVLYRFFLDKDIFNLDDCLHQNETSTNTCTMQYLSFPLKPLLYGYFQPVYSVKLLISSVTNYVGPAYICHDRRLCDHLRPANSVIEGLDCHTFPMIPFVYILDDYVQRDAALCYFMGNINNYTSESSLFYCKQSRKYISRHRLIDGINDCYYGEDETYADSCSLNDARRFKCKSEDRCLSPIGIGLNLPDCLGKEDTKVGHSEISIFPRLCTSIYEFNMEDDETDETNCEWWPCHTPYTRCDKLHQCANGIDELNCPNVNCKTNEYQCFIDSDNYHCIPQEYIYEMPVNCSGSMSDFCRQIFYSNSSTINTNNTYISWQRKGCIREDDICGHHIVDNQKDLCQLSDYSNIPGCSEFFSDLYSDEILCRLTTGTSYMRYLFIFSTWNLGYSPAILNQTSLSLTGPILDQKRKKSVSILNASMALIEYCNRGIVIFEGKSFEKKCLCPPNYYGNRCQWQNQRVSLTLQMRISGSYERRISVYDIFIYLLDDQNQIIHNYEKITYLASLDCHTKYNRYLLYPNQPKHPNYTYSLRIDVYEKVTLNYYGSWYLSIPFLFLPVNRIAAQIRIPFERSKLLTNCPIQCGNHGRCFSYVNSKKPFCYCDQGYAGRFCNVTYQHSCSSDSVALNSSICLCPPEKFGSKCYLSYTFCQTNHNPCKNQGKCMPLNDRIRTGGFICLCNENYTGSYCEHQANRIDIRFKTDPMPSIIFAQFITAFSDRDHQQIMTFQRIPFGRDSVSLNMRESFHILFVKLLDNYYLAVLRENSIPGEHISTDIKTDAICPHITKLLNSTLLSYSYLRRLKYYPMQCSENQKLECFYDEQHMCVCDKNRFSNCFKFNHQTSYECQEQHYCENNGKCLQDNLKCPTKSICVCEECYYGHQCQLTTKGFSISLDVIFGYQIKPSLSFSKQSVGVKITASITIIMLIAGVLNGIICVLTFRRQSLIEVGCGVYLLTNSVISILIMSIFSIKYCQLVIFQMNLITNHSFVYFNCILTDVLLKILVTYGDWLNAFVTIERALTVAEGTHFSPSKSKSFAKHIIPIALFLIIISYIHDPISRELFYDEGEQRTWCTVIYSTSLKIFDRGVNILHFLTPFIMNFLSALMIIIQVFRSRSKIKQNSSHTTLLYVEIQRHRHLLISPCILILLAFPRFIMLLTSRCMKSAHDPWLFLVGYYISFIPPLLICPVFILPSEKYKKEFLDVIRSLCVTR